MSGANGHAPDPRPDPADRRVFLAMPGYGPVTAGAAAGFFRATRLPDADAFPDWRAPGGRCYLQYAEGSLLANSFNTLWCAALNLVREGRRLDHFAMIHADVEPEKFWLDRLLDELEARDLDVLGVVAPIKDTRGVTSTALARPDGDPWRPLCRLTMQEVHRLPETFTSEDLGHPLLLNTGLWACRFDEAWAAKVHFAIHDRIAFDPKVDRYHAVNESEDWFFSRLLHEIGAPGSPTAGLRPLRIGCTRAVRLAHRGAMAFGNDRPWGTDPFDRALADRSLVPDDPADPSFRFPHDVDGWLTPAEGVALARLARGRRVLEVGAYCGRSTICLAQAAAHVVSVDTHDGRGTPGPPRDTLAELRANLERYGVDDKVWVRVGSLYRDRSVPRGHRFDLAFVDGAHDRASVDHDIACARDRLAPGGLLALHDYRNGHPDVTAAVDALVASGAELRSITDSLAVVEPPASMSASLEPAPLEV